MRLPFYVVCTVLIVSIQGEEGANLFGGHLEPRLEHLEPVNLAVDQETVNYLLPKLASKYRPSGDWSGVADPRFYVLTDMETNDLDNQKKIRNENQRNKRNNYYREGVPSLSINAPIKNLQKLYQKESLRQRLEANRKFLQGLVDMQ